MTERNEGQDNHEIDPLAQSVDHALSNGWCLIPNGGYGVCENALTRTVDSYTDLVTLPPVGHSLVVRLHGGPSREQPRRTGTEWFRHHVPPEVALTWVLLNPQDNDLLLNWEREDARNASQR